MKEPVHETIQYLNPLGISMQYITTPGGYHPLHWHDHMGGQKDIPVEGKTFLRDRIRPGTQYLLPCRCIHVPLHSSVKNTVQALSAGDRTAQYQLHSR